MGLSSQIFKLFQKFFFLTNFQLELVSDKILLWRNDNIGK